MLSFFLSRYKFCAPFYGYLVSLGFVILRSGSGVQRLQRVLGFMKALNKCSCLAIGQQGMGAGVHSPHNEGHGHTAGLLLGDRSARLRGIGVCHRKARRSQAR